MKSELRLADAQIDVLRMQDLRGQVEAMGGDLLGLRFVRHQLIQLGNDGVAMVVLVGAWRQDNIHAVLQQMVPIMWNP